MQNTHTDSNTTAEKTNAAKPRMPGGPKDWRTLSNMLCIWTLCGRGACRKAGACRGDSRECIPRCGPLVPEDARDCVLELVGCQRRGMSFDDARDELPLELFDALIAWNEAAWRSARQGTAGA
jgi:hypothetical protein